MKVDLLTHMVGEFPELQGIMGRIYALHNGDAPGWLRNGTYTMRYKFDAESVLNFYRGIFTNAALERITGINQKQIQHYASGLKKPRPAQLKKIESAFRKLGNELLALEL